MNHAHWREERTFFEGDEYFEDVLQAIDSSKTDVILETYIFNPDEIGRRFEDSLIRASQRGVKIRLLVDGIGGSAWIPVRNPKLKSTGIETRVYHPIIFANLFSRLLIDLGILKSVRRRRSAFFSRINRRDHRKFICVDGNKAWVGSLNISAVHSKSVSGAKSWADTGLFVTGEHVRELIGSFENVWRRSHDIESGKRNWRESVFRNPATIGSQHLVRLNSTTKLRRRSFKDFVKRISKSRSRIWITNAYLAPSAPVSLALCKAAQRGVDVRLLVPRQSDVFFMPLVTRSHYEILLADRVKIYEYLPHFLHAKCVIVDDWSIVGTSNMNRRSLLQDLELDVVTTKPETLELLVAEFENKLKSSERILKAGGFFAKLLGRLIEWFLSYWI